MDRVKTTRPAAAWKTMAMAALILAFAGCGGKDEGKKEIDVDPTYRSEINLWRIQRQEAVTNPDGLLSPIGL